MPISNTIRRGIDLCARCGGASQIEYSNKDAGYVRRSRACQDCGSTWSTAEITLPKLRILLNIEKTIRKLKLG